MTTFAEGGRTAAWPGGYSPELRQQAGPLFERRRDDTLGQIGMAGSFRAELTLEEPVQNPARSLGRGGLDGLHPFGTESALPPADKIG